VVAVAQVCGLSADASTLEDGLPPPEPPHAVAPIAAATTNAIAVDRVTRERRPNTGADYITDCQ
jgi:hypothetical protein